MSGNTKAYALLGLAFLIVFTGAFFSFKKAEAPITLEDEMNNETPMSLTLTSPAFNNGEAIPSEYTCDGDNVSPPLTIGNVPEGAKTLVLVMDDPDIPEEVKSARGIEKVNHWVVYNIPPHVIDIPAADFTNLVEVGLNSAGAALYIGPCPPPEYEPTTHRYIFRLYAISGTLNFIKVPTLDEVEEAAKGMMIEKAELVGTYDRNN